MHAELSKLSQDVQLAVGQLFQNDQSLKTGLDAAEFNLRAHQKVINAVAVDVLDYVINKDPVFQLPTRINTIAVEEPMTDSAPAHTRVSVDWVKYHGYVEAEMKAMAEEARKADLVKRTEQVKDLEDSGKLQKFKEHIYETIEKAGEDQEARKARADAFFNDIYAQIALIKAEKEYSGAKLDVLIRMIAEDEKHSAGTTAPQEEIGTLAEPPAEVDEDTNVFGG
jgi:hypothetical protein